jgi:signal transduction histidine kinase
MNNKRFTGLLWEIVISLALLMVSALVLIGAVVLLMWQYQGEYQTFTPFILMLYILLFAIVISVFGYLVLNRVMLRPIRLLLEATEKVAAGDLDFRVDLSEGRQAVSGNEITHLADAFNRMTERLKDNQTDLREHLQNLEKVNRDLKRTQDQLIFSEKLASIGHLAAGVAHEIGNPLSAILGYLEILERKPELNTEELDMLKRVKSEVNRIHHIIKDLLDYSRQQDETIEEVRLNAIIKDTMRLMEPQKTFKGIEVDLELDDSIPQGKGTLGLTTKILKTDDGLEDIELSVSDTGTGIPEENQKKIFEPFFTTKEPGKGSGLGLSICQRIVESMSGKIEVMSGAGKGTVFIIRFPRGG